MATPERIGRYRVLGELGQGAMGTVYRAHDDGLEREVAVKVMSRGLADAEARARFLREARAAARLQHPNIVVIYELGEHAGAPFMALELLEGVDLQHAIDGGLRPDPRATLPLVLQLLAGLGHAHEHGIVHRDVKPSNVFLPVSRPVKIMDFGVARLSGLGTTTSGAVVGTPNYMSPEQVGGGEIDGRSDLFSVGLILYELVTGEKAVKAQTVVAAMYEILHELPDLSLIPSEPSWQRLRGVLERTLARAREDRYPDAAAMSADLAAALVALGGSVDPTAPADQALLRRPKARIASQPSAPAAPAPRVRAMPPETARAAHRERPISVSHPRTVLLSVIAVAVAVGAGVWFFRRPAASPDAVPRRPVSTPSAAAAASDTPPPTQRPTFSPLPPLAHDPQASPAPTPAAIESAPPVPTPIPGAPVLDAAARLARARDLVGRSRWAEALAEARAVLETTPTSTEAGAIAQQAEAELVIEDCLRNARAALREGDRERALDELRRGFLVRNNDARLLALHREAVQQ